MDGLDEALRLQARFKVHFGAEERRNPQGHELAEDVAERQSVQKMQRVKDAFVLEILLHLGFDGVEAREHVAVGVDDALGFGGGARSEQNLKGCIEGEAGIARIRTRGLRQIRGEIFECHGWAVARQLLQQRGFTDDESGLGIDDDAVGEVGGSGGIERNGDYAALHAAEKRAHPLGAVRPADHDALAHEDFTVVQLSGEAIGEVRNFIPRRNQAAIAAMHNDGCSITVTAVVVEKCGKAGAHKREGIRFP